MIPKDVCCHRHGPAFGLSQQQATGDPLLEVLMRSHKPCTLIDKPDSLNRYLTGQRPWYPPLNPKP